MLMTGVAAPPCLFSCSRFCFLRLAMLAPPAAAYIAPRSAVQLFLWLYQNSSEADAPVFRYEFLWSRRMLPTFGPCHVADPSPLLLVLSRKNSFFFSCPSFILSPPLSLSPFISLSFSHSFFHSLSIYLSSLFLFFLLLLSGKARNMTVLRSL